MRIAHIVSTFPPYYGGMGNVAFEMVSRLSARGHEVVALTPGVYEEKEIKPKEQEPVLRHEEDLESRIDYARRLTPSVHYGNAARLPQIQKEMEDFDIVHLHYPFFGTANLVRKWKLGRADRKLVVTYHMDTRAPNWKGLLFSLYAKYWMPKILGSADLLTSASFDYLEASGAQGVYHAHKNKWIELPFGVDTTRFYPGPKSEALAARIGIDPGNPTILFVGGMDSAHYFKGIPVLLSALSLLSKTEFSRPLQAVFVGDGELRVQFEAKAKALGLGGMARFVGHATDDMLPEYYRLADLLVLPSTTRAEAFGMVLLEAFASGIPVVASDIPGVRAVAYNGGTVVTPGNAGELAENIRIFFSEEVDRKAWSKNARAAAEELYDWDVIIDKLESTYTQLLNEKQ